MDEWVRGCMDRSNVWMCAVVCAEKEGYKPQGLACVKAVPAEDNNDQQTWVATAVAIGVMLSLSIVLLFWLVRKHPVKARRILLSFVSVEVQIVLGLGFDVLNFYTESAVRSCACVRACVRACVSVCMRACVRACLAFFLLDVRII